MNINLPKEKDYLIPECCTDSTVQELNMYEPIQNNGNIYSHAQCKKCKRIGKVLYTCTDFILWSDQS